MKRAPLRPLIAAVILILTAAACSDPARSAHAPSGSEFSQLTKAGIAEIKRTRHARFDLRNHELTKAAVGLEGTTMGPIVGGADQPDITLELLGPFGTETVQTSTMAFMSTGPASEPIEGVLFWRPIDTPEQALDELRSDIGRWGLNPEDVDWWERNTRGESEYQMVISMGVGRSGLVIDVEAYLKHGKPLLKYDVYLNPEYYTPEAQESIRKYGKVH